MKPMKILSFIRSRESQNGQIVLAFLILFPVFIICLFISTDVGRLLVLKNQLRIAADSAALAAAGALDIRKATQHQNFMLNESWANDRALEAISEMKGRISEDDWMQYDVTAVIIDGLEVTVIVDGKGETIFGGYLGINTLKARAISHARAAVGIDSEW